jgi:hypothetical protein
METPMLDMSDGPLPNIGVARLVPLLLDLRF